MATTVYGIPNCDTVKKARTWLDGQGIAYEFHDYKKAGIAAAKLKVWCKALGWETVLNRAGTTFRRLPDDAKAGLNQSKATALMIEQPSMIKRPIVEYEGGLLVGFKQMEWEAALGK
jgi:Spx/MgsR family transcriptional regulator